MESTDERSVRARLASARAGRSMAELLEDLRSQLWVLVILFFCIGDIVTTHVGLSMAGVIEAGPVVAPVLERYGLVGMVGLKGAVVALFYWVYRLLPEPQAFGVPFGLAGVGVGVTVWNLAVLGLNLL